MEYTRAYRDEQADTGLVNRHWKEIFPLMHKRYLFAGVDNFLFYDVWNNGTVNENIFAYYNLHSVVLLRPGPGPFQRRSPIRHPLGSESGPMHAR